MRNVFYTIIICLFASTLYAANATVNNKSNSPATAKAILFNNISGVGAGTSYNLGFASDNYSWTIVPLGSPSVVNVDLECTNDGTNWIVMDTYSSATPVNFHRSVNDKTCATLRGNIVTITDGAILSILTAK